MADSVHKYIRTHLKILLFCLVIMVSVGLGAVMKGAAEHDPIFSKREDSIYATLREAGYSHAGVCGIMGNMSVENPDFEPDLTATHGITYGLFQWNNVGERRKNLTTWCNNRLLNPATVEGQLAFAIHEMEGGDPIAKRLNEYLKTTTDAQEAAMEFCVGFERCVGSTGHDDIDATYSGDVYPRYSGKVYQALAKRERNAQIYDNAYADFVWDESDVLDIGTKPTPAVVAEAEDDLQNKVLDTLGFEPMTAGGAGLAGGADWDQDTENSLFSASSPSMAMLMLYRVLSLIIGYICGCMFLKILLFRRRDISNFKAVNKIFDEKLHSSFVGMRNTAIVVLGDILKMVIALVLVLYLTKGALGREGILWAGLGVILGNDYPFWNHFKGGIGATVTIVALTSFMPLWGPLCCLIGLVVALIFKNLPLGTFAITLTAVPFAFYFRGWFSGIFVLVEMFMMLIKQYSHLKKFMQNKSGKHKNHNKTKEAHKHHKTQNHKSKRHKTQNHIEEVTM